MGTAVTVVLLAVLVGFYVVVGAIVANSGASLGRATLHYGLWSAVVALIVYFASGSPLTAAVVFLAVFAAFAAFLIPAYVIRWWRERPRDPVRPSGRAR